MVSNALSCVHAETAQSVHLSTEAVSVLQDGLVTSVMSHVLLDDGDNTVLPSVPVRMKEPVTDLQV